MTESERSGHRAGGGFLEKLAINIQDGGCTVIAFTGGGGKTSLIFRLTKELTAAGKKSDHYNHHPHGGRTGTPLLGKRQFGADQRKS